MEGRHLQRVNLWRDSKFMSFKKTIEIRYRGIDNTETLNKIKVRRTEIREVLSLWLIVLLILSRVLETG